jgi:ABC-type amino acid transport substrate-binding protein
VGQNLITVSQRNDLVHLLSLKALDLVAANPLMLRAVAARKGVDSNQIDNILTLVDTPGGFYFAVNPQTDPALLAKLHAAFKHLRDGGQLLALQRKYNIN